MSLRFVSILLLLVFSCFGGVMAQEEEGVPQTQSTALEKSRRLFGPRGPNQMVLTLDQCISRALTYNLELQAADYAIQSIEGKREENSRIGHPIVEYEYNLAPIPRDVSNAVESFFSGDLTVFNKFRVAVGVPLQTFGKVKLGKQLASTGIAAEKEKKNQKKEEG